jgi:hypothetical protein
VLQGLQPRSPEDSMVLGDIEHQVSGRKSRWDSLRSEHLKEHNLLTSWLSSPCDKALPGL